MLVENHPNTTVMQTLPNVQTLKIKQATIPGPPPQILKQSSLNVLNRPIKIG